MIASANMVVWFICNNKKVHDAGQPWAALELLKRWIEDKLPQKPMHGWIKRAKKNGLLKCDYLCCVEAYILFNLSCSQLNNLSMSNIACCPWILSMLVNIRPQPTTTNSGLHKWWCNKNFLWEIRMYAACVYHSSFLLS